MTSRDTRVAASAKGADACGRSGFTLLELVVVLAIMGLGMAIVATSLVLRSPSTEEALQRVVADARRVATRRAQTVTLDVDAEGAWQVAGAERDSSEVLLSGELGAVPRGRISLRITPLGLCLTSADSGHGGSPVADPLTCSMR